MSPNKGETAVHGCHCPGDMVVRMRTVLAIPRGWYVCLSADKCQLIFTGSGIKIYKDLGIRDQNLKPKCWISGKKNIPRYDPATIECAVLA